MSTTATIPNKPRVIYPESDGLPIADNTTQFEWIVTIEGGLEALFHADPNVFVAGDLLWYPIKENTKISAAPDVMVVFGRPKRHRGSYVQSEEDDIPPQVVFEIWSPSNRAGESVRKFQFFERHGVEEYYLYDPADGTLDGWKRVGNGLEMIPEMQDWVSPRLQVKFALQDGVLNLTGPDGKRFATFAEVVEQRNQAQQRAERLAAQLKALGRRTGGVTADFLLRMPIGRLRIPEAVKMTHMSTITPTLKKQVVYPESDGLPLSDNTKQFRWIMTIQGGLDAQYLDDPNVFVAGNLLWYPIEGDKKIRSAPDIFVAIGRPKGDRGSYQQWLEGNIAPQVTFEIVSPGNTAGILTKKFNFYDKHGVDEYYLYDPDDGSLDGWQRKNGRLVEIPRMDGWVSPLLGIKFELQGDELRIIGKNGEPFVPTPEAIKQRDEARAAMQRAEREKEQAQEIAGKLAAQLKALGVKPEA